MKHGWLLDCLWELFVYYYLINIYFSLSFVSELVSAVRKSAAIFKSAMAAFFIVFTQLDFESLLI